MKYFIAIIFIGIALICGLSWEFPSWVYVGLVLLFNIFLFFWEYKTLQCDFLGDFEMKSHRKSVDMLNVVFAILYTTMYVFDTLSESETGTSVLVLVLFWSKPLVDLVMHFMYKKKKPTTIFISGDWLLFNNRWTQKRDLKTLNYIGITSFATELKLGFSKKSDVIIPMKEYKKAAFRQFLNILVEKSDSKHEVYLIDDLKKRFPALPEETQN